MDRNLSPAEPADVGLSAAGLARIDAALNALIGQGELAGVVTLAARHGRVVHRCAQGLRDLATAEPLTLDTIFRIFSMTKPVTAAAMMILHDEGRWRLEDPIARFLPAFADVKVFGGVAQDGRVERLPPDHAPTLKELLTHTAGFSYGFDPADPVDDLYKAVSPLASGSLTEMAAKLAALPLAYQPGTQWRYSLSMDLQGAIIEALSGQSLPDFMRTRIFEPLGMVDTAFHVPPDKRRRLATLYRMSKSRGLVATDNMIGRDYEAPPALAMGGGGLFSTAADYARFAQMLLNKGEFGEVRILSPEAVALMTANHLSNEIIGGGFGVGVQTIRPGFGYGFNGAVFTDPALAGSRVGQGTYQWDGAAGTWFWVDPENDLLYVGLIQRMALPGAPSVQAMTQEMMAGALVS
ncbi:MAG TPA: serine hydrolase domain-containing protein [Caulobacteraceae bacterium]|jgi:CubicO group peptidase (beta-lactamase class C family)